MTIKDRRPEQSNRSGRILQRRGNIRNFVSEVKMFEAKLQEQFQSRVNELEHSSLPSRQSTKRYTAAQSKAVLPEVLGQAIATIRSSLGLTITELAKAASVERQTIYAWIRGDNEPQHAKRKRLAKLYDLACEWNKSSPRPAKELFSTMGELLAQDYQVETILSKLKTVDRAKQGQNRRESGLAALLAKHNINIEDLPDQDEQFDLMTGKADAFGDDDEQGDRES